MFPSKMMKTNKTIKIERVNYKAQQNDEIGKALTEAVNNEVQKELQKAINTIGK